MMKDNGNQRILRKDSGSGSDLVWLDALKAFALLWIFWNHVIENIFGGPYFANPNKNWPGLSERFLQITPIPAENPTEWVILNLARYIGWLGDQGVQIFLVLSGFGLVYGCLRSVGKVPLDIKQFYIRRFWRIFPLWLGVHFLFLVPSMLSGNALSLGSGSFYLSLLGFRASTDLLYYYSPAWWYIGLLIQLYLIFPFLWAFMLKNGPLRSFCWLTVVCVLIRLLGLMYFEDYLDAWSRGAIFISRLPEFLLGMLLGFVFLEKTNSRISFSDSKVILLTAGLMYVIANALSFFLVGMAVAPLMQAASLITILYLTARSRWGGWISSLNWVQWTGKHSYSLFLVHHPLILFLPSPDKESVTVFRFLVYGMSMLFGMYFLAFVLERITGQVEEGIGNLYKAKGLSQTITRVSFSGCLILVVLLGAEFTVRNLDPQEVLGWGERPSLEIHSKYGWHLKPEEEICLRWSSYDYKVTSNEQGFPAPSYPKEREFNTFRIITIGDAYTSAEGVDTFQSWPRLMEDALNKTRGESSYQVLNYAVTGYGPNQYLAVLKDKIPEYHPDLFVVEFFLNDFFDVQTSDEMFLKSIGFNLPAQNSFKSIFGLTHLSSIFLNEVKAPIKEYIMNEPDPYGYFIGNFQALEKKNLQKMRAGADLIQSCLQEIIRIADQCNSRVMLALVPAPVQISNADELDYYPVGIDLTDSNRFSIDQPQVLMIEIIDRIGLSLIDLRGPLIRDSGTYQRKNMHFTHKGHEIVSEFMTTEILKPETPRLVVGQTP